MRRAVVSVAVVIAGLALLELLSGGGSDTSARRAAPALPRQVLVAPAVRTASLRGRPAVVHFWASWCGPCHREAHALARLPAALGRGARVVGVDWNDDVGGARRFLRRYGWSFPNLRDRSGAAGERWGLVGLPTTFLLDRRGRIARTLRGPQTVAGVRAALHRVEAG